MSAAQAAVAFQYRNVPRIFCIGRNYADHINELGNQLGGETAIVFMKPPNALIASDESITLPRDRGAVHFEAELVVEIGLGGSDIAVADARSRIRALGLGLDLTLRDEQTRLKNGGEPWERAKAFEASAALGPMTPLTEEYDLDAATFELSVDGEMRQRGRTDHMITGVAELIAALSRDWNLAPGDLIYTGTPAGVGELAPGMDLSLTGDGLASGHWSTV